MAAKGKPNQQNGKQQPAREPGFFSGYGGAGIVLDKPAKGNGGGAKKPTPKKK